MVQILQYGYGLCLPLFTDGSGPVTLCEYLPTRGDGMSWQRHYLRGTILSKYVGKQYKMFNGFGIGYGSDWTASWGNEMNILHVWKCPILGQGGHYLS